jgi:hypothetical protein
VAPWIASRSLSSGAHSRDPLARNDGALGNPQARPDRAEFISGRAFRATRFSGISFEIAGLFRLFAGSSPIGRAVPIAELCLFFGTYEEEGQGVRKDCAFSRNGLAATAGGRLQWRIDPTKSRRTSVSSSASSQRAHWACGHLQQAC